MRNIQIIGNPFVSHVDQNFKLFVGMENKGELQHGKNKTK
jgi:hypothetical protein